ncbi:hypothetical protein SAMN05216276_103917 [Streptosporangium subroseum]|uniref:Uncharacterized protein n=1 Tax=Streptosporangium subroseum TaxID=106412 RepID=A0A239M9K1_9ACTN|nr:hypothetical protein SAMN05216276_103917 [Streptosporangium subroseum]
MGEALGAENQEWDGRKAGEPEGRAARGRGRRAEENLRRGTAGGTPVAPREASAGLNYQEALLMNRTAIFD